MLLMPLLSYSVSRSISWQPALNNGSPSLTCHPCCAKLVEGLIASKWCLCSFYNIKKCFHHFLFWPSTMNCFMVIGLEFSPAFAPLSLPKGSFHFVLVSTFGGDTKSCYPLIMMVQQVIQTRNNWLLDQELQYVKSSIFCTHPFPFPTTFLKRGKWVYHLANSLTGNSEKQYCVACSYAFTSFLECNSAPLSIQISQR